MKNLRYALQDRDQLPERLDWLTPDERARYEGFRFDKRQQDWLLGRWAAKQALLELTRLPQSDIARFEIASAPDGAPLPRFDGRPCSARLSLSHRNDRAFSVVSKDAAALGCDIELVEPRSPGFVETWFTESERERVRQVDPLLRDVLVTMIWSAKESTLKALRTGLQADTRSVEVLDDYDWVNGGWKGARTIAADARSFSCLWRLEGPFVLSLVTNGPLH